MNFLQLQNATMADRFDESQRGSVKDWLNSAYWQAWSAEEWTFSQGLVQNAAVTSGSSTLGGVPADMNTVRGVIRGDGWPVTHLPTEELQRRYYNARSQIFGRPEHYSVWGAAILLGPIPNETASDYLLLYDKEFTALANDADTPAIPAGAHMALVFKASATGLKLQNDFTWQFHEQDYQEQLEMMRNAYLASTAATERQIATPAYRAGW